VACRASLAYLIHPSINHRTHRPTRNSRKWMYNCWLQLVLNNSFMAAMCCNVRNIFRLLSFVRLDWEVGSIKLLIEITWISSTSDSHSSQTRVSLQRSNTHSETMDSFTIFTISTLSAVTVNEMRALAAHENIAIATSVPADEEHQGSGANCYCVIAWDLDAFRVKV